MTSCSLEWDLPVCVLILYMPRFKKFSFTCFFHISKLNMQNTSIVYFWILHQQNTFLRVYYYWYSNPIVDSPALIAHMAFCLRVPFCKLYIADLFISSICLSAMPSGWPIFSISTSGYASPFIHVLSNMLCNWHIVFKFTTGRSLLIVECVSYIIQEFNTLSAKHYL